MSVFGVGRSIGSKGSLSRPPKAAETFRSILSLLSANTTYTSFVYVNLFRFQLWLCNMSAFLDRVPVQSEGGRSEDT